MDLDGYAVGGLAVGETHEEMYRILDAVVPYLPQNKPTYLMAWELRRTFWKEWSGAWISSTAYTPAGTDATDMSTPTTAK